MKPKTIGPLRRSVYGPQLVNGRGPWFCLNGLGRFFHIPRQRDLKYYVEVQDQQRPGSRGAAIYVERQRGGSWRWGLESCRVRRDLMFPLSEWLTRHVGGPKGEVRKLYIRLTYEETER